MNARDVSTSILYATLFAASFAHADEGMWTFDNLPREKTIEQVIFLRAGNLLQAAGRAVVVSEYQAVRRNERRRAAAQIRRCAHGVIDPRPVGGEIVFRL